MDFSQLFAVDADVLRQVAALKDLVNTQHAKDAESELQEQQNAIQDQKDLDTIEVSLAKELQAIDADEARKVEELTARLVEKEKIKMQLSAEEAGIADLQQQIRKIYVEIEKRQVGVENLQKQLNEKAVSEDLKEITRSEFESQRRQKNGSAQEARLKIGKERESRDLAMKQDRERRQNDITKRQEQIAGLLGKPADTVRQPNTPFDKDATTHTPQRSQHGQSQHISPATPTRESALSDVLMAGDSSLNIATSVAAPSAQAISTLPTVPDVAPIAVIMTSITDSGKISTSTPQMEDRLVANENTATRPPFPIPQQPQQPQQPSQTPTTSHTVHNRRSSAFLEHVLSAESLGNANNVGGASDEPKIPTKPVTPPSQSLDDTPLPSPFGNISPLKTNSPGNFSGLQTHPKTQVVSNEESESELTELSFEQVSDESRASSVNIPAKKANKPNEPSSSKKIVFAVSSGIYTSPKYLKGVPVSKISESGPFWDSAWNTYDNFIQKERDFEVEHKAELETYEKRVIKAEEELKKAKAQHNTKAGSSKSVSKLESDLHRCKNAYKEVEKRAKGVINRVANSEMLYTWLQTMPTHPNQLLARRYIVSGGLLNRNYLVNYNKALEKLKKAKAEGFIRAEPLTWLRKEIFRAIQEHEADSDGSTFNVKKFLIDLWPQNKKLHRLRAAMDNGTSYYDPDDTPDAEEMKAVVPSASGATDNPLETRQDREPLSSIVVDRRATLTKKRPISETETTPISRKAKRTCNTLEPEVNGRPLGVNLNHNNTDSLSTPPADPQINTPPSIAKAVLSVSSPQSTPLKPSQAANIPSAKPPSVNASRILAETDKSSPRPQVVSQIAREIYPLGESTPISNKDDTTSNGQPSRTSTFTIKSLCLLHPKPGFLHAKFAIVRAVPAEASINIFTKDQRDSFSRGRSNKITILAKHIDKININVGKVEIYTHNESFYEIWCLEFQSPYHVANFRSQLQSFNKSILVLTPSQNGITSALPTASANLATPPSAATKLRRPGQNPANTPNIPGINI